MPSKPDAGSADAALDAEPEQPPPSQLRRNIGGVAHADGTFVAVSIEGGPLAESYHGAIYVSEDGALWSRADVDIDVHLWSLAHGNGRFVAVGSESPADHPGALARAFASTDGRVWQAVDLPHLPSTYPMAFGRGMFVVAGYLETRFMKSTDGLTWSVFGPRAEGLYSVEFAAERFVAWTESSAKVALLEGDDWEFVTVPLGGVNGAEFMSVRAVADRFVAVTFDECCFGEQPESTRWGIATSADGRSWTVEREVLEEAPPQPLLATDSLCLAVEGGYYQGSGKDLLVGPDCDDLTVVFEDENFTPAWALAVDGALLVWGEGGILRSADDGVTWTRVLWNE